jgi:hypothetical protein
MNRQESTPPVENYPMSLDQNIRDVLKLQDVELANAMNTLKNNPAALNQFITTRKAQLYNTVTKEHSDNFQKVYSDLGKATDTTKNILYYHVRNKDLDRTQEAVLARAVTDADNATYDSQVAKRQVEINEWTSNNKMDTLFFFQLLFIGLTLLAPLLYMSRTGMIPNGVFYGVSFLIVTALVFTVAVRAQYTEKTRDLRFWNRRRFQQMGGPPTPPTCESLQGLASDLSQGIVSAGQSIQSAAQDIPNPGV